jgi:hypothetical protein
VKEVVKPIFCPAAAGIDPMTNCIRVGTGSAPANCAELFSACDAGQVEHARCAAKQSALLGCVLKHNAEAK